MLRLAAICFAMGLISALFGFGSVFNLSWEGAKILCLVFLVLAVVSFVVGGWQRRSFVG